MILSTTVLDWRIDGGRRIYDKTNGDTYLLNFNNMAEVQTHSSGSWMYYFDNRNDRRDRGAYLKCSSTPAQIITASDVDPASDTLTLPVFPKDVQTATAVDETIMLNQLSRAWAHVNGTACYVVYTEDGWDTKRVLCDITLAALETLIGI